MSEVIFTTIHGSRLYGLHHQDSDHDIFAVCENGTVSRKPRHIVKADHDLVIMDFDSFVERYTSGSHQAVEALFSPYQVWNKSHPYQPFVSAARVGGGDVFAKYERTIRSFAYGEFKRRRHAVRLAMNLDGLREEGKFIPVMTPLQINIATSLATNLTGDELLGTLGVPLSADGKEAQ